MVRWPVVRQYFLTYTVEIRNQNWEAGETKREREREREHMCNVRRLRAGRSAAGSVRKSILHETHRALNLLLEEAITSSLMRRERRRTLGKAEQGGEKVREQVRCEDEWW